MQAGLRLGFTVVAIALGGLLLAPRTSQAALTVDLRAVSTTNGTVVDAKTVLFDGPVGGTVTMDVYMVITGMSDPDPDNDFLDYLHGSFLSSFGGLRGDLKAQLVFPDYGDFISSNGFIQDLDGDADLDVGSNDDSTIVNFFRSYKWREAPRMAVAKIATLKWTSTLTDFGAETLINFRPQDHPQAAHWLVDGLSRYPLFDTFTSGPAVLIKQAPEPAGLAALSSAVMLLLRRRC
jgi:hypothetical protein